MLKEIKEFKLKKINDELNQYKEIDIELAKLKSELDDLKNQIDSSLQLIQYKHFNWFQKNIYQRKEYKNYVSNNISISKDISQLKAKQNEMQKRIDELNSISSARRRYNLEDDANDIRRN